ncbi:MAG: hypothetical protein ACPL28_10940 [bacterium]
MVKAIGLLSGGLDSTLAVKLMLEQGIVVIGLNFVTPFCTCTKKGCQNQAKKVAEKFGIELRIISAKEDYISLVKNPKYGYGRNMNSCIDCRIFMFSRANEYMKKIGASFVFTGEVLGERPMSQNLRAMRIIEKESGLEGRLLRPLCARYLPPTVPEKDGIVDRNRLLSITGRSRKPQISLVQSFGIEGYPCPAGGCRLTDPNFAKRLKDAFEHNEDTMADVTLLRYGRHFRLPSGPKVIVGRNEQENEILKGYFNLNNNRDLLLETRDFVGPIVLLKNYYSEEDIKIAAKLCLTYSDYKQREMAYVKVLSLKEILIQPFLDLEYQKWRI